MTETNLECEIGMGIDTTASGYGSFKNVSIRVEIVCIDFGVRAINRTHSQSDLFEGGAV